MEESGKPSIPQQEIDNLIQEANNILKSPPKKDTPSPTDADFRQIAAYITPTQFEFTSHPPEQYDHTNPNRLSPMADEKLAEIRKRLNTNPSEIPTLYDLQQVIHNELEDIRIQQQTHKQNHPNWIQQGEMVMAAYRYFQENTGRDTIYITLEPEEDDDRDDDGDTKYEEDKGNMYVMSETAQKDAYVLTRDRVYQDFEKFREFVLQSKELGETEEIVTNMMAGNLIPEEEKIQVLSYLVSQTLRWHQIQEQSEGRQKEAAERNEKMFSILLEKTTEYPTSETKREKAELTEAERQVIENHGNFSFDHELKPFIDEIETELAEIPSPGDIITEAEEITKTAAKARATRRRGQKPQR